jgi:hypothetical protein
LFTASLTPACASSHSAVVAPVADAPSARPRPSARPVEPHWEDLFARPPELLVVIRPRSLREDRVYGPLFRHAVRLARERSKIVAATRLADSLEDADEVVLGVTTVDTGAEELVLVENGVRADVDPARLVDDDGALLWGPGPSGPIRELVAERSHAAALGKTGGLEAVPEDVSLFELPGRTWVIASGAARDRARDVFVHPLGRPRPAYDDQALAFVRMDGAALVSHVNQLRGGPFSPVGQGLVSALLSLPPGADHAVVVTLEYSNDDSAMGAESVLRDSFGALGRSGKPAYSWLGEAKVERTRRSVVARAPLPAALTDALLSASPSRADAPPRASTQASGGAGAARAGETIRAR